MKIRTLYFKVPDLPPAVDFYTQLLQMHPGKHSAKWVEWKLENSNFALLVNDFNDNFSGSNCVPVFEFPDKELKAYIERAKALGAEVIVDGLKNPDLKSVVCKDPWGNEFELSKFHV